MSAFILGDAHISAIIGWYKFNVKPSMTAEEIDDMGQRLVNANYESVNYRYHEKESPFRFKFDKRFATHQHVVSLPQLFMACHCYEYQACEYEGYWTSEAHDDIALIVKAATKKVQGYEDCEWVINDLPHMGLVERMIAKSANRADKWLEENPA